MIAKGLGTAESKRNGAGIGASMNYVNSEYICTCSRIEVTGGTVKATHSDDVDVLHDIGQGYSDTVCGTVSIDTSKAKGHEQGGEGLR